MLRGVPLARDPLPAARFQQEKTPALTDAWQLETGNWQLETGNRKLLYRFRRRTLPTRSLVAEDDERRGGIDVLARVRVVVARLRLRSRPQS